MKQFMPENFDIQIFCLKFLENINWDGLCQFRKIHFLLVIPDYSLQFFSFDNLKSDQSSVSTDLHNDAATDICFCSCLE